MKVVLTATLLFLMQVGFFFGEENLAINHLTSDWVGVTVSPTPIKEKTYWKAKIRKNKIRWSNKDLFVASSGKIGRIFTSFAEKEIGRYKREFEANFENSQEFKLVSVVGDFVSFEHESTIFFANTAIRWRLTTIDLSKQGDYYYPEILNTEDFVFSLADTKVVCLTEIFSEKEIVKSLKNEPTIRKHLARKFDNINSIKGLYELIQKNNVFWENREFELSPDFITRFAFFSEENRKMEVRISLSPRFSYNRGQQRYISLRFVTPPKLKKSLERARSRKLGLLMVNASKIFRSAETRLDFIYQK